MSNTKSAQERAYDRVSRIISEPVRLTPTEAKVMRLFAEGYSSQQVADRLVVTKRTVDFHSENIYKKLQVNNRIKALREAIRLGLIPFEPFFGHTQGES